MVAGGNGMVLFELHQWLISANASVCRVHSLVRNQRSLGEEEVYLISFSTSTTANCDVYLTSLSCVWKIDGSFWICFAHKPVGAWWIYGMVHHTVEREFMNEIPHFWLMMNYGKMKETLLQTCIQFNKRWILIHMRCFELGTFEICKQAATVHHNVESFFTLNTPEIFVTCALRKHDD